VNAVGMNGYRVEGAKPPRFVRSARVHIGIDRARERPMPTVKTSSRLDFAAFCATISDAGGGPRTRNAPKSTRVVT